MPLIQLASGSRSGHPARRGPGRASRRAYHYPNGSTIVVGGLDDPAKVMSTEDDLAFVQEAIELAEADWEALTTHLRHGVAPSQQLLADTNPDGPGPWPRRRADAGRSLLLEPRHEDNPLLWEHSNKRWTPAGAAYLAKLDALRRHGESEAARLLTARLAEWATDRYTPLATLDGHELV